MALAIPTVLSSLVMVIYSLADTYFVGMLDNPVQNAAETVLAAAAVIVLRRLLRRLEQDASNRPQHL